MNDRTEELFDLLIAQATIGLQDAEADRLDLLLLETPAAEAEALAEEVEQALAAAATASTLDRASDENRRTEAPPASLTASLEADADRFFGKSPGLASVTDIGAARVTAPSPADAPVPAGSGWNRLGAAAGWAVAALLLVVVLVRGPGPEGPAGPLPVVPPPTDRAGLAALDDSIVLPWAPPDDPEFVGVRGDVTWNDRLQTGFLRLSGMPVNDPALAQYQLWIVDPDRDEKPVDGGVFDISVDSGEVIIPIRATLPVSEPAAFAITREKPGGVVVSEGPLRVVASAG